MNIKTFFNTIQQPFVNFDYYKKSINTSVSQALLTFFGFLFAMATISGFYFVKTQLPGMVSSTESVITEAQTHYPEDLEIKWDGTELDANRETFEVYWPNNLNEQSPTIPKKLVLFKNSQETPDELGIDTHEYLFFVNKSSIYHVSEEENQVWVQQNLSELSEADMPFTLTKEVVNTTAEQVLNLIETKYKNIELGAFLILVLLFVSSKIWFLAIETLFVILVFKLYSVAISAKQTLSLTLHVMIPTVVVNTIAELLYGNITIPLQTITFWILIILLSFQLKKKQ